MSQWIGWLELVAEEALLVVAFLVVFEGCRRLARHGFSRRSGLMVAIALILPVWEASMSLRLIRSVQLLQAEKMAAVNLHGREPAGGWEKAAPTPEARTALSIEAATIGYVFQGVRSDVIDAGGARVPFVPTLEQGRAREQFVRDEKGAEASAQSAFERGVRLFIGTACFMLAGLVVGWRQRTRVRA
jgi:hypothetical protein